jgi:hypothetical protein
MSFVLEEDVDPSQVRTFLEGSSCMLTLQQPVIYIPCDETDMGAKHARPTFRLPFTSNITGPDIGDDTDQFPNEGYSPFNEGDLPGGYVARVNLYRAAWQECLGRIEVRLLFVLPLCARVENRASLAYHKFPSHTRSG